MVTQMIFRFSVGLLLSGLLLSGCSNSTKEDRPYVDSLALNYKLLRTLPHDTKAFTQGLIIVDNKIIESTGLNNQSWIAEVNPATGDHDKKVILDGKYFGEGITIINNKIYQLTYKEKVGFIYNANTYKRIGEFPLKTDSGEGWGITHNGVNLIVSDGTSKLYFLDTVSLKTVKTIQVKDKKNAIRNVNELEYVNGVLYANVWESNYILRIDPNTGTITGKLDLSSLANEIRVLNPEADVLNGIAYDVNSKAFLVTGKFWPRAYLIRIN